MARLTYRLAGYLGSLVVLISAYALAYQWGMATFEGEQRTWYQALEAVVQSMTTTGYGQDAPWESLEMTALVMLIQLTGIAYIVVAIPQFVIPWIQTLVQPTPPGTVDQIEDHVIVVGYTALCDTLVDELAGSGTPYVILEDDEDRARTLHESGVTVLHGDPAVDETLEAAQLESALAVVVDATERDHVRTVLVIEDVDPEATVVPLVPDPTDARFFRYAGVDEVLSPRHRLGKALADRVRPVVDSALENGLELGEDFDLYEFHVDPDADLFGESVAATRRLEATGATVIGAWVRGDFVTTFSEHSSVDQTTSLLVAGTDAELEAAAELTGSSGSRYRTAGDPVIVLGTALVATTARGVLERADLDPTVVTDDPKHASRADVVGEVTDEETLHDAGIEDAATLLVALEADDDAIRATLTARALNPTLDIIAGATTTASVDALRAAGADTVLALPSVAGRMVTRRLFDQEVMVLEDTLSLREVAAPKLAGTELSLAEIREATDCSVLALTRDGEYLAATDGIQLEDGVRPIVVGTEDGIDRFRNAYGTESERDRN